MSANYLREGVWNSVDGLEVQPKNSPHSVETIIPFFRVPWRGYRTYAHLADIVSARILDSFVLPEGISGELRTGCSPMYRRPVDIKKIDAGRGADSWLRRGLCGG